MLPTIPVEVSDHLCVQIPMLLLFSISGKYPCKTRNPNTRFRSFWSSVCRPPSSTPAHPRDYLSFDLLFIINKSNIAPLSWTFFYKLYTQCGAPTPATICGTCFRYCLPPCLVSVPLRLANISCSFRNGKGLRYHFIHTQIRNVKR